MSDDYPIKVRNLPFKGKYRTRHQEWLDRNEAIQRIEEYLNRKCFENKDDKQIYMFESIALELKLDKDFVQHAIVGGGHNGITLLVTNAQRLSLARRFSGCKK